MTIDELEFIDLKDSFYCQMGIDATNEEIEKIISLLEKDFKIKRKNYPTTYISII